jgi:long-chain fatty acid transport protein
MKKLGVLAVFLVLGAASTASATNGMRMIGFGPTQESMGGIGVAAGFDAAAMASNPALMSQLGPRLDLGVGYFKPTVSYDATAIPQMAGMAVNHDGQSFESSRGASPIPALGAVLALGDDLRLGLGVYAAAGMGVDYGQNLYNGETHSSYLQGRFTPSLSYRIGNLVSVGATLNVMMAQMSYDVASGFLQQKHDTATALGLGGVLGVAVTPLPMLTIGAAYETKSSFQKFKFDIPAHNYMMPDGSPSTNQIPATTDELSFDQPQVVTFGAAVKPLGDTLLVAAEVEWIDWAQTNGANLPSFSNMMPDGSGTTAGSLPFNLSWKAQWVYKVGAQLAVTDGLKLRVGYNYGKSPLDAARAFENVAFPAVSEHHITCGGSYAVGDKLALHVSAVYSPETKLTGANGTQYLQGYRTSMSQFQADLGVTYRF